MGKHASEYYINACIDLPILVAENRISDEYDYALNILLDDNSRLLPLPITIYKWNGCCALIMHEKGEVDKAIEYAKQAIQATEQNKSGLPYHSNLGLVEDTSDDFGQRIKQILEPAKKHSLFRRFLKIINR